jgi:hypothetical protein
MISMECRAKAIKYMDKKIIFYDTNFIFQRIKISRCWLLPTLMSPLNTTVYISKKNTITLIKCTSNYYLVYIFPPMQLKITFVLT